MNEKLINVATSYLIVGYRNGFEIAWTGSNGYMWTGDFNKAKRYASKAMAENVLKSSVGLAHSLEDAPFTYGDGPCPDKVKITDIHVAKVMIRVYEEIYEYAE